MTACFVELDGIWFNVDHIVVWTEAEDMEDETVLYTVEPIGSSWQLKMTSKAVAEAIRMAGAHTVDLR